MKVLDVIETCNKILDLNIPVADISSGKAEPCDKTVRLISCCNDVLEELYCGYPSHVRKTVAEADNDGFIATSQYRMHRVLSLCDGEGVKVPYRYTQGGLLVSKGGKYNLTYARLPQTVGLRDSLEMPSPAVTDRIFVYGVLREYCLQTGDFTSSAVWQDKFSTALSAATRQASTVMPARRWL